MSKDDDDPGERGRVFAKIAPIIVAYYKANPRRQFHVEELRQHVLAWVPDIAPDSPGRILRELRQIGQLNYLVVNRRQSLYRFLVLL